MKYTFNKPKQIKQIQTLMKSIGWSARTKKQWEKIIDNSDFFCSLWDKDSLVGIGRMVTDYKFSMLYDVIVHPDYQRKGHGERLIRALIRKCPRGSTLGLFVSNETELQGFYEKFGFEKINGMILKK